LSLEKKLVVKNGVGRALLDTSKSSCKFTLEPSQRGWLVSIEGVGAPLAATIEELKMEIHFFYYEDDEELNSHHKWWLSDLAIPALSYDALSDQLIIEVSERIGFTVDSSDHVVL
jgi:hypothetical protein